MITYFTFDKELINRTCHILQNILRIDFYTLSFEYFILNTIFIHYSKEILVTIMEQFVQQKMAVFLTRCRIIFRIWLGRVLSKVFGGGFKVSTLLCTWYNQYRYDIFNFLWYVCTILQFVFSRRLWFEWSKARTKSIESN